MREMREGVDWALGVEAGVVVREAARSERVLMVWPGRMVGGTLTLKDKKLDWKRSRWPLPVTLLLLGPILTLVRNRGPSHVTLDVHRSSVAPVGRMVPWLFLCLLWLTWWGIGLLSTPLLFRSGWSRRCIAVHSRDGGETYCFAVRDVDGWVADIAAAGGKKATLVPWRLSELVLKDNSSELQSPWMPETSQTTG